MVIQTKPDGNCFFQAIAINIARNKIFNDVNNIFSEYNLIV